MKYTLRLIADFEIEAENIMQADDAAKHIGVIGERVGGKRLVHMRDAVTYGVRKTTETRQWVSVDERSKR